MKKLWNIVYALGSMAVMSCSQYSIHGSTDLEGVDGRMLFLQEVSDNELVKLDSCDVVHGKFKFNGPLDSIRVVELSLGDNQSFLIPIVLENGNINVVLTLQSQKATGTQLNDSLTAFRDRCMQMGMQADESQRHLYQAYLDGTAGEDTQQQLDMMQRHFEQMGERLFTSFISENFDNCLAPYVFQMATSDFRVPVLEPWIEALMVNATPTFKNNTYIKEYMKAAAHNRDIMNGMAPPPMPVVPNMPPPPTPNQLAKPQQ